jgi:uncharacterized membrane protein YkvA (DUF1232 family)
VIFGKRRRHPLPKFPSEVGSTFRSVCQSLPVEDLPTFQREFDEAIRELEGDPDFQRHRKVVEALADRCRLMLKLYPHLSEKQKALVIGACRYVALVDDPLPEEVFASGFNDDIKIVNHVLEQLGVHDRFLPLAT